MVNLGEKLRPALAGGAAGLANGFFGGGGGMLLVPLLKNQCGLDQRRAFATSVAIILPLCILSSVLYWLRGGLDLGLALPYVLGGLAGGLAGGKLFRRVNMAAVIPEPENELKSGPFLLNVRSRSLTKDGKKIDLTQVEFQLMEHFLRNPNVALDRSSLLATVWGDSYFGDDKIVDVNMRRLRMKVEDEPSKPKYLTTVWGFGYKWVCPDRPAKEAER